MEILSTHNLLCWKFATGCRNSVGNSVCRKITTSCPAYFFNRRHRWF